MCDQSLRHQAQVDPHRRLGKHTRRAEAARSIAREALWTLYTRFAKRLGSVDRGLRAQFGRAILQTSLFAYPRDSSTLCTVGPDRLLALGSMDDAGARRLTNRPLYSHAPQAARHSIVLYQRFPILGPRALFALIELVRGSGLIVALTLLRPDIAQLLQFSLRHCVGVRFRDPWAVSPEGTPSIRVATWPLTDVVVASSSGGAEAQCLVTSV